MHICGKVALIFLTVVFWDQKDFFAYGLNRAIRITSADIEKNNSDSLALLEHAGYGSGRQATRASNLHQVSSNSKDAGSNSTRPILRVVTIREHPFVEYHNISNGTLILSNKSGPGVVMEILKEIRKRLDVEFEYREPDDGVWGEEVNASNGAWSGMIGMLQRKEADILAGAAIMRYDRAQIVDQSYTFYTSDTGMLIRAPGRFIENRFLIVTAPFQWQVWALTALTIIVSGCIMQALCRAMRVASEVQYTWSESVWMFFSVFVQQGLPVQPKSWTCRTMLAFWWLAALTLVATFTGNMVALFAVNKAALPFNNEAELLEHVRSEGYKIVTPNNSMTRIKFMQSSRLTVYRDLWYEMNSKQKWINVSSLEEGISLVKSYPKLVLLGPMETLQIYSASDCLVATTSNGIIPVMYSIMLQKDSPYTEYISNASRQLVEMGMVTKWLTDYQFELAAARGNFCVFSEGVSAAGEPIDISHAQGAFWILLAGVVLGSGIIILEHVFNLLRLCLKAVGIRLFPSSNRWHMGQRGVGEINGQPSGSWADCRATNAGEIKSVYRMMSTSFEPAPESAKAYQPASGGFPSSLKHRKKPTERQM